MKKSTPSGKKERLASWAFLLPSLLGVTVFFILPFLVVIYYSFIDNPINKSFAGLDNYIGLMQNDAFRLAASNTMIFTVIAVPLAVVLSLLLAVVLDYGIAFKSTVKATFLCPLMVPTASVVLVFQVLFHKAGTINQLLAFFHAEPVDWLHSKQGVFAVILMFFWKNLGYNMILFLAGMRNIPQDLLEVATLEGAGAWYKFVHVKLRYLSSTIFFVMILSIINAFKVFREVYLLTGDYPFDSVYMLQHFMNNTFNLLEYQKLSSAAILVSFAMIVVVGILFLVESVIGKDVES